MIGLFRQPLTTNYRAKKLKMKTSFNLSDAIFGGTRNIYDDRIFWWFQIIKLAA